MAVYLGRAEHDASSKGLKRVVLEFEGGELVVAPGQGDALELEVVLGHERERHELELHEAGLAKINSQSKLIKIEDGGGSIPDPKPTVVRQQSQLIKIEDTRGRLLPAVTILLP